MKRIEISNIEQFKTFFDVIYDTASETIELKFLIDRMTCAVLDRSHSRFMYVEYKSFFFDKYDVDEVGSVSVSVVDMFNLLKLTNKTDTLILDFGEDIFSAEVISKTGNKRSFEFVLPYEFVNSPSLPDIALPVVFEVETSELKQSVKDISLIGTDIFQFVVAQDSLTCMSDTMADTSSYSSTKYANAIECDVDAKEQLIVRFNIDYIAQMLKFEKIQKIVSIQLGEQALVYKFDDDIMGVTVHGLIAPRTVEEA